MERLRQYLADHDLTQNEFALKMGVRQPTVWEWINGKSKPGTGNLIRMSEVTGISIDELLTEVAA